MSLETVDIDRIRTRKLKAENLITDLCHGNRWRMSIPVKDDDSDVVMQSALNDIDALLAEVERVTEERDGLGTQVTQLQGQLMHANREIAELEAILKRMSDAEKRKRGIGLGIAPAVNPAAGQDTD